MAERDAAPSRDSRGPRHGFRRKNIPVWITEYGNETKPGEPKGVTEAKQAALHPAGALGWRRKDTRIPMFIWFVMQDSQGSLWQSGIYRQDATPKRAGPANGHGREYCTNNPTGARPVGTRSAATSEDSSRSQGASPLGIDCTVKPRVTGAHGREEKRIVAVTQITATTADPPHDRRRRIGLTRRA